MEKKDKLWKLKKIVEYIRVLDHPNAKQLKERFRIDENVKLSEVTITDTSITLKMKKMLLSRQT